MLSSSSSSNLFLNTVKQYGEKVHVEYGWSYDLRERILQLSFQLVRTNDPKRLQSLQDIYYQLLLELNMKYKMALSSLEKDMSLDFLKNMYKLIGQTRDVIEGKGEYTLAYMMIYCWYLIAPELACYALRTFVTTTSHSKEHPYGSWKDVKYFCNYCISKGIKKDDFIIVYAVSLINDQLKRDLVQAQQTENSSVSLAAKWVPRERSNKFGWLYEMLATDYFSEYIQTANQANQTNNSLKRAISKCKANYRKLVVSRLNEHLDTLEIIQCNQQWSNINFKKVTSISLAKQTKAFLNVTKDGSQQRTLYQDRMECADHFKEYIEQEKETVKGKRLGLNDFTKKALELISNPSSKKEEIELLNAQWINHSEQNEALGRMIAMVDVSKSMEYEPVNAAIALGIRIAEKSALGKRVLTFSGNPKWINLDSNQQENNKGFVEMVKCIQDDAESGTHTNFYGALSLILEALVEVNMAPEEVQDLMLVVLSDMQMDGSFENESSSLSLYENIKEKYREIGLRIHGKPYKPPHILFWNLRSTMGFPTLSNQPNSSMLSGFNPVSMNLFTRRQEQSTSANLQSCTPWDLFMKSLENKRYEGLEKKCLEYFSRC